jgi:hypothetical protein
MKIHLSQAEFEDAEILYDLLVARDFPFLEAGFKDYPFETHESVVSPAIKEALQFIYE